MHGDIPCSEALMGLANTAPKIDKQEDIYNNVVLKYLADGIETINEAIKEGMTGGDGIVGSQDSLFANDITKWLSSAYALKARYLFHIMVQNPKVLS